MIAGVQRHSREGSLKKPQGHPCVAFLPCELESAQTAPQSLPKGNQDLRPSPPEAPPRPWTAPTTGSGADRRRGQYPQKLGGATKHPCVARHARDHPVPRLQPFARDRNARWQTCALARIPRYQPREGRQETRNRRSYARTVGTWGSNPDWTVSEACRRIA
jgi:hypothetical protein